MFTLCGLSHLSLLSPPCLAWRLLSTAAPRNTIVDEFHNIAEGHAALFCEDFLPILDDQVLQALRRRWPDRTLWGPYTPSIPPTAMDQVTSMNGVDKEAVAKHADILLLPFFRGDDDVGEELFRSFHRYRLACNLLGKPYDDKEEWRRAEWDEFLADYDVPWRAVYDEYVRPLSELCRSLLSSWQSRERLERGGYLDSLIRRYIAGARLVHGEQFVESRTVFHRLMHLPAQALGECETSYVYCHVLKTMSNMLRST